MDDELEFVYPVGEEAFHRVTLYYCSLLKSQGSCGSSAENCQAERGSEIEDDLHILGPVGKKEAVRQAEIAVQQNLRPVQFHRTPVACRKHVQTVFADSLHRNAPGSSLEQCLRKACELERQCFDMCRGKCEFPAFQYSTVVKCSMDRIACVSDGLDAELILGFACGQRRSQSAVHSWLGVETEKIVNYGKKKFMCLVEASRSDQRICALCNTWQSGNPSARRTQYKCWNCGCKNSTTYS